MAEGVLNPYLVASGIREHGVLKKVLKRLPKVRLNTSANVLEFFNERAQESGEEYKRMVGSLSEFDSVASKEAKRIDLDRFSAVKPMNAKKVFSLHPVPLFPKVPSVGGVNRYSYRRTKPLPEIRSARPGRYKILGSSRYLWKY